MHRRANHRINKRLLNDAGADQATRDLAASTMRMNTSFHEFFYEPHELLYPLDVDASTMAVFTTLRAQRERYHQWIFAMPRARWLDLGTASQWAIMTTRSVLCTAWTLCLFPRERPSDESNVGTHRIRQLQAIRQAGVLKRPTTMADLSRALDELVSQYEAYTDAILLMDRLEAVKDAYVHNVLDLVEAHADDPWTCGPPTAKEEPA